MDENVCENESTINVRLMGITNENRKRKLENHPAFMELESSDIKSSSECTIPLKNVHKVITSPVPTNQNLTPLPRIDYLSSPNRHEENGVNRIDILNRPVSAGKASLTAEETLKKPSLLASSASPSRHPHPVLHQWSSSLTPPSFDLVRDRDHKNFGTSNNSVSYNTKRFRSDPSSSNPSAIDLSFLPSHRPSSCRLGVNVSPSRDLIPNRPLCPMLGNNLFSSTSSVSGNDGTGTCPIVLGTADTGGEDFLTAEEQFEALKEGSQNLMETLSISQQCTQEYTQTFEDSPLMCLLRLRLHPEVERSISIFQKKQLESKGLYRIEINHLSPRIVLGRDCFVNIFDKKTSCIDPIKLSRTHCILECLQEKEKEKEKEKDLGVYITDKSTNGIRIDGQLLEKDKPYRLCDGQKITLLSSRQGRILLGYVVEDPHVVTGTTEANSSGTCTIKASMISTTTSSDDSILLSQENRNLQEYTLGVLFSSPIVGKDIHGKYHPIAELDVKREYSILQQSLFEASKYATCPSSLYDKNIIQYPRQINVCAKFANTENFRTMVTVGCRALHFSGHGDEKHLYFEDGMGLVHPIPHSSLQELFSAGGVSPLRLAFVSACSSAPLAHAFVSCGIPHVIAVKINQKIEDHAAIEFTRAFYLALATGKTVGASFMIAQQSVAKSPNIRGPVEVAGKFLLLPENGDHSEVIFPLTSVEGKNDASQLEPLKWRRYPKLWFDDLPAICQGFCNRSVEVYKICLALMLNQSRITRLVTICGEEGIGKTAVAYAVANYVGPRITSEGGIKIFSVAKIVDQEEKEEEKNNDLVMKRFGKIHIKSRIFNRLEAMVQQHLNQSRTRLEFNNTQPSLIVLDGCDEFLLKNDTTSKQRFRCFLSDLLTHNALLKIVLTARTSISADGAVEGHGERVYTLTRFTPRMSAKMLLSLVSRPIRFDEIKRAKSTSTTDKLEILSTHPVLLATMGIPKKIADLAGKLNQLSMDEIQVDPNIMEMTTTTDPKVAISVVPPVLSSSVSSSAVV